MQPLMLVSPVLPNLATGGHQSGHQAVCHRPDAVRPQSGRTGDVPAPRRELQCHLSLSMCWAELLHLCRTGIWSRNWDHCLRRNAYAGHLATHISVEPGMLCVHHNFFRQSVCITHQLAFKLHASCVMQHLAILVHPCSGSREAIVHVGGVDQACWVLPRPA